MSENKSPVLEEDRASRVSFGDWTHDDHTLSTFRTQLLIDACGVRPETAAVLGTAVFGESNHGWRRPRQGHSPRARIAHNHPPTRHPGVRGMIHVDLPQPRGGQWPGVMLPHHDSAGSPTLAVTIRSRAGHLDRKWFTDDALAIAFALDQADTWQLPLIDLRESEAE